MVRFGMVIFLLSLCGCGMLSSKSYCELASEAYAYCFDGAQLDAEDQADCEEQAAEMTPACVEASTELAQCYVDNQVCNEFRAAEMCGDLIAAAQSPGVCQ